MNYILIIRDSSENVKVYIRARHDAHKTHLIHYYKCYISGHANRIIMFSKALYHIFSSYASCTVVNAIWLILTASAKNYIIYSCVFQSDLQKVLPVRTLYIYGQVKPNEYTAIITALQRTIQSQISGKFANCAQENKAFQ